MSDRPRDKVSHFLDDEDDDFNILDGIGKVGSSESKTSVTAKSPIPSSGRDDVRGMGRVEHYRGLQGFVQALSEAAPLFIGEKLRHPDMDEIEIRNRVALVCRKHLDLVNQCLEVNKLDASDTMLRYQRRTLAKMISQLYRIVPIDTVKAIAETASDWQLESKEFESTSAEPISTDSMLNVKMALFTAGMRARVNLNDLWCDRDASEVMKEIQKIGLDLARQVAFSWSKRSHISDQESLFVSSLPHCLELTEVAYRDQVISQLPALEYIPSDPQMEMPHLASAIDEMDMGYEGEERVRLINRVRDLIRGYFTNQFFPAIEGLSRARLISAYIETVDLRIAQAWEEAASTLFNELEEMTEEERDKYAREHEMMDVEPFFRDISHILDHLESPLEMIEIDFDDVAASARRNLAWVWGISDSLIAARKETLGDLHS